MAGDPEFAEPDALNLPDKTSRNISNEQTIRFICGSTSWEFLDTRTAMMPRVNTSANGVVLSGNGDMLRRSPDCVKATTEASAALPKKLLIKF
jgi:hypothetical protein